MNWAWNVHHAVRTCKRFVYTITRFNDYQTWQTHCFEKFTRFAKVCGLFFLDCFAVADCLGRQTLVIWVFLWSFVLQCGVFMCLCAGAVLYYYFYKRTALRLGDPRFYKDSEWLRQEFSRTHWFRPKACGKCQKLGPTVWKRSSLHKLKSFWSSSLDQHWNHAVAIKNRQHECSLCFFMSKSGPPLVLVSLCSDSSVTTYLLANLSTTMPVYSWTCLSSRSLVGSKVEVFMQTSCFWGVNQTEHLHTWPEQNRSDICCCYLLVLSNWVALKSYQFYSIVCFCKLSSLLCEGFSVRGKL